MKSLALIASGAALILSAVLSGCGSAEPKAPSKQEAQKAEAPAVLSDIEKVGFLTTKDCAKQGAFTDCRLESYVCGYQGCNKDVDSGVLLLDKVDLVLFVHTEGHSYNVDIAQVGWKPIDKGINRNEVTLIGKYNEKTNTIHVKEFKAPPPPKKSFFKGCL